VSLINEALKRTRDASYPAAAPAAQTYRMNESRPPVNQGARTILWVTFAVAMLAGVFMTVVLTRASESQPLLVTPKRSVAPPVDPVVAEEKIVAKVVEKMKTEQPPVAPVVVPEPLKFVLQGVTSDGSGREALVNGSSVRVGDEIEGARVLAIDVHAVKLQLGDRELVLRMP